MKIDAELANAINHGFDAKQMEQIYRRYLVPLMIICRDVLSKYQIGVASQVKNKFYFVMLFSTFIFDPDLRNKLIASLPEAVKGITAHTVWWGECSSEIQQQLVDDDILKVPLVGRNYYMTAETKHLRTDYCFFSVLPENTPNYDTKTKLTCTLLLVDKIREYFKKNMTPPPEYYFTPVRCLDDIEANGKNRIYQNQGRSVKKIHLCKAFVSQKLFKISKSGKPLKSTLQQLYTTLELTEFYPNDVLDIATMHAQLWSVVALAMQKQWTTPNSLVGMQLLQQTIDSFLENKNWSVVEIFMAHVKGMRNVGRSHITNINPNLLHGLKDLPLEQWISIDHLQKYLLLHDIDVAVVGHVFARRYLYYMYNTKYGKDKQFIYSRTLFQQCIILPTLKGYLFLMATLGLVDIAYAAPKNADVQQYVKAYMSIFDGLKLIRLTKLGAFLLGITKEYEVDVAEEDDAEIIVDEDRLLLSMHGKDSLKSLILEQMTTKVGKDRYKMDYASFLKQCDSQSAVNEKINNFKQNIAARPPQIWLDFFEKILRQIKPLTKKSTMNVYKIADNQDLLMLMVRDPLLKKLVLKMEDRHVAIDKNDYSKVRNRLLELGFLNPF